MSNRIQGRDIDNLLRSMGLPTADHSTTSGGHGRAEFTCLDGLRRFAIYSTSKHGGRGLRNVLASVKRQARGLNLNATHPK